MSRQPSGYRERQVDDGISPLEGLRPSDSATLRVIHAEVAQHSEDLFALHELRDALLARDFCHLDDHLDHGAVDVAVQYFLDEASVDFHVVDVQMFQIGE